MNRTELENITKQDVKEKSIKWEKVKFIQREIEDLLGKLYTKQQFNYLEAKRGLQLHIIVIDEVLKKHELIVDPEILKHRAELVKKEKIFRGELKIDLTKEQEKEAIAFYKHLLEHPEVKNAPIYAGIPMCKICGKTSKEILKHEQKSME